MPELGEAELALRRRVGRNIRRLAEDRGLTLVQLADFAQVELSHLSRAINGKQAMTTDRLAKLAAALEVDPAELLGRDMGEANAPR